MLIILSIIGAFTGKFGKPLEYLLAVGGVLAVLAGALWWHDGTIRAQVTHKFEVASEQFQEKQQKWITDAVAKSDKAAINRAVQEALTNRLIDAAPVTTGCVQRPQISAALAGNQRLRSTNSSSASTPAGSKQLTDLQGLARRLEGRH